MEITTLERGDGISHLALRGRFDTTSAEELEERFYEVTAERHQSAIIDLSGITFIASRGIGMLFAASKRLKADGRALIMLNPQDMVERVLKSSKMDKVMPIVRDLNEALRVLGVDPGSVAASSPSAAPELEESVTRQARAKTDKPFHVSIKNKLSELAALNQALHQFADDHAIPGRAAYAVDLAIEELIVNVIRYAYVDDDEHWIDVDVTMDGEQLVLRLVDDGRPFDPREGPEFNPNFEDGGVRGLGLILVLDLVQSLKYERVNEKNRVEVCVSLIHDDEGSDSVPLGHNISTATGR